jgi:hypothetical protein
MLNWWAIAAGLLIEFPCVRYVTKLSNKQAALADLVMNAASTSLGILLIPIAGLAWEIFPGSIFNAVSGMGTFNPFTWSATVAIAAILNTFIERFVLRRAFKQQISQRGFWLLFTANCASVGLAFASLWLWWPET